MDRKGVSKKIVFHFSKISTKILENFNVTLSELFLLKVVYCADKEKDFLVNKIRKKMNQTRK